MKSKLFVSFIAVLGLMVLASISSAQELLSNPGFETWTAGPGGPPDSWSISYDTLFSASREAGTVHGGTYSVALACSTYDTRWIDQLVPVTHDSCYRLTCYVYDNDTTGSARIGIRWFTADTVQVGELFGDYTVNQVGWQQLSTGAKKAPPTAALAYCDIRVYEEDPESTWTHTVMYADDASFTKVTCPAGYDTLTIEEIQYNVTVPGTGNHCYPSPYDGQTYVTEGIVTKMGIASGFKDFWIQDGETVWDGVFVFQNTYSPNLGDRVRITAEVDEYYGVTEMKNLVAYQVVSTGNPVPDPIDIVPGNLADHYKAGCDVDAEPYEGLLVKLTNVICVVAPDDKDQWYVTDYAHTDTCQIDDYVYDLTYDPAVGDTFSSITGIVHWSYNEYEIDPRFSTDVVAKTPPIPPGPAITGICWTPTIPADSDPVTVMASIFDTAAVMSNQRVYYRLTDTLGVFTNFATLDSASDNYHYFTLPGQDPDAVVYFYVYAENDTGGVSESPKKKYKVMDEPPLIKINEFLYDTPGTDAGCFIEIYGASGLSLNGYSLIMVNGFDGTDKKVIDLSGYSIPGDGYFVVAQDATVPNYDLINALADFENGPDNIHIKKDGFIYDAVGYGTFLQTEYFMGETWPTYDPSTVPYGFSLGRYPGGNDTDYNRHDFGAYGSAYNTPGTANLAPAELTVQQIQQVPKSDSPHVGKLVKVGGVVTAGPECTYNPGYYIEMSAGGQWSGVLVYDLFNQPTRGDSVSVIGTVQEDFNRTQIGYIKSYTNLGPDDLPSVYPTSTGNVATSENLEGVLVQVQEVTVVDTMGYGEFLVTDGAAADTVMVDDICGYSTEVAPGDHYALIRGVVDYTFGRFKIQPRDDNDFMVYAPANLNITKAKNQVHLQWNSVVDALYYIIYRHINPSDPGDSLVASAETQCYVVDEGDKEDFYTVHAVYYVEDIKATYYSSSRMVGSFDKDLKKSK